ncbi:hypothetical protein [Glycomyces xiaoerkulensis]|uniref:hypothetical protein n=1 Tax=Glycomyces xiaoerkulensis TaxID=2038139 RepID=UPI000C25E0CD|nr:hypothetical protein [Glycomyces xiaoerkulensis]
MTDLQLGKLFAWVIGVLSLIWLLAQCMGGPVAPPEPDPQEFDRDSQFYAEDCRRTWEALEMMGELDHENVDQVVDEIDLIASEITDPELSEMAYSFGARVQEMVAQTEPGDDEQLQESYMLFRGLVEVDLSMRCTASSSSTG